MKKTLEEKIEKAQAKLDRLLARQESAAVYGGWEGAADYDEVPVENCTECSGSGTWGDYTVNLCYACNGTGKNRSPEENWRNVVVDDPRVAQWVNQEKEANTFASSCLEFGRRYGRLTEPQKSRVRDIIVGG